MKKILIFTLVLCLFVNMNAFAFNDTEGHWAESYAEKLNKLEYFNGDDKGNANLQNNITRAEFIALVVRIVYGETKVKPGRKIYSDVSEKAWYHTVICNAFDNGLLDDFETGMIYPSRPITREEMVIILSRAIKLKSGKSNFKDVPKGHNYYIQISNAVESGIVQGYSDNTFKPGNNATRGECCALLCRVIDYLDINSEKDLGTSLSKVVTNKGTINLAWDQIYSNSPVGTGMHMNGLNIISPTWFKLVKRADGEVKSYDISLGTNDLYIESFANSHYAEDSINEGYETWAMFNTDGTLSTSHTFLSDATSRKNSCLRIKELIKEYKLSGIILDFENMNQEDADLYVTYTKELTQACHSLGAVLSVCVNIYEPSSPTWSLCYDRKKLAKYADYIMIMAYDEYSTWSKVPGPVASIQYTKKCITKTLEEVPNSKLVLGIPSYARLWKSKGGTIVSCPALYMDTVKNRISDNNAEICYDSNTGLNYAQWLDDEGYDYVVWIEDETSLSARIKLMEEYNLPGIAIWSSDFMIDEMWNYIDKRLRLRRVEPCMP